MEVLRGQGFAEILSLVRAIEAESGIEAIAKRARNRSHCRYYLRQFGIHIDHESARFSRVVLEAVIDAVRLLLMGKIRQAGVVLWLGTSKWKGVTDVSAAQVRVKNNVLASYPDIGLVAKFGKPLSVRDPNSVHNEYLTLSKIAAFNKLQAPEPIAFQRDPIPTLWMKYVNHSRVTKEDTLSATSAAAKSLLAWFEHHGVVQIPPSSYNPLELHLAAGTNSLVLKGWNEEEAMRIYSALETIAESRTPLFLSQIHGDASTGNIMITQSGSLIINDWEMSRLDIVGYDMVKLIRANPEVQDLYSQWRLDLAGIGASGMKEELALVRIMASLDLEFLWKYWTEDRFLSAKQAQKKLVARKLSVMEVCDSFDPAT